MLRKIFRGFLIGCVMSAVSLVAVGESSALCGLFQRKYDTAAAMYGGSVCNPCGQQLVCNYVPQTCYRVQYVQVPTVTYRPVTSCSPCGGQTTAMLPQTTYVQQARYMPYTTYRLSYSIAQPACGTATTAYYAAPQIYTAPGATVAPAMAAPALVAPPASGCSSCGTRGAATTYYAPAAPAPTSTYYAPSPGVPATTYSYAQPSPAAPSYTAPSYAVPGATVPSAGGPTYYRVPAATAPAYTPAPSSGAIVNNGAATIAPSLPPTTSPPTYSTPRMPTPAPPAAASPAPPTTYERKVDPQSTDAMKPIPDPQISTPAGPKFGPTSAPRLYDPQDKTAFAWPVERAWSYSAVGAGDWKPATTQAAAVAQRQPILQAAVRELPTVSATPTATLGGIVPSAPVQRPAIDGDGWQSSSR